MKPCPWGSLPIREGTTTLACFCLFLNTKEWRSKVPVLCQNLSTWTRRKCWKIKWILVSPLRSGLYGHGVIVNDASTIQFVYVCVCVFTSFSMSLNCIHPSIKDFILGTKSSNTHRDFHITSSHSKGVIIFDWWFPSNLKKSSLSDLSASKGLEPDLHFFWHKS